MIGENYTYLFKKQIYQKEIGQNRFIRNKLKKELGI